MANERRVAIVPATVQVLTKKGFNVQVEDNAGMPAEFTNEEYIAAGAAIKPTKDIYASDFVMKIRPPSVEEAAMFSGGNTLFSQLYPAQNPDLVKKLGEKNITAHAMDCVPRISRAQVCNFMHL